jgi:hypothetical protein
MFIGSVPGIVLARLPDRFFLQDQPWITEQEILRELPEKAWVVRAILPLFYVWFFIYVFAFGVWVQMRNEVEVLFMPILFFIWMFCANTFFELFAQTTVVIGKGSGNTYIISSNARKAAALRLVLMTVAMSIFLYLRFIRK